MEWKTEISKVEPNKILIRGYNLGDLIGRLTFGGVAYLLLTGEYPTEAQQKIMDAMLVAGCDHSLAAPSTQAARLVASSGVPLQAAVAAGITSLGDYHGGAIDKCAKVLQEGVKRAKEEGKSFDEMAEIIVKEHRERKERIQGFGHPYHTKDPRVTAMMNLAKELGIYGEHCEFAKAIERALEKEFGRHLPLNVDGGIAALMSELGLDWRLGKGFYVMARSAGLVAHVYEEMTKERPFRVLPLDQIIYNGPPERPVPK
ncbi:MAG: citryl-CoA lyase [Archaeoglobi archaeon]|nr:citryl-CoA lyase [Candidatus Mnemosynella bozhongmuii]